MASTESRHVPLPADAASVELHCLDGGSFVAAASKVHAGATDETFRMYNWAFYIRDVESGRHILWDLGLSGVRHKGRNGFDMV